MLSIVAAYTGWRASELASLTPSSFDLDVAAGSTEAGYAKNRRVDELPLHSSLVEQLRLWILDKPGSQPLWPASWARNRHVAEMLRSDLEAAGIPYVDRDGPTFDFHALRGQFSSGLVRAGVHPRSTQVLLRHSDIKLTMNLYTHVERSDLQAAVEKLPPVPPVLTAPCCTPVAQNSAIDRAAVIPIESGTSGEAPDRTAPRKRRKSF